MVKRAKNGRWLKGTSSPCPGGRPKEIGYLKDLARQHTEDAIQTLVSIAKNPKSSDSARVSAATALLDRAYGRPSQYVESVSLRGDLADYLDQLDTNDSAVIDL